MSRRKWSTGLGYAEGSLSVQGEEGAMVVGKGVNHLERNEEERRGWSHSKKMGDERRDIRIGDEKIEREREVRGMKNGGTYRWGWGLDRCVRLLVMLIQSFY